MKIEKEFLKCIECGGDSCFMQELFTWQPYDGELNLNQYQILYCRKCRLVFWIIYQTFPQCTHKEAKEMEIDFKPIKFRT